ncbi:Late embryogenesis abundant protein [Trema orientale]|uniref:Late embryogenesis abundant protein n=1 Tax=Trema orientale TaxID=63057 RepID=A0A2P5G000_TREOI|nr:Late embryogenesis abundant protein [Trema orientale]
MADHQKVHPAQDVEAPPTPEVPLVPQGASKSDRGDPAQAVPYPPFRRTIPVMHSKPPKKRRSCLCRCLCCIVLLIVLQIVVVAIAGGVMYLVFRPKLPKFSVDKLQVTQFNVSDDQSLSATFDVTITARNPNKKIGIYYEGGSRISVWYVATKLCEGALPKFYQGHRNTTRLVVPLAGQTQNAGALLGTLQEQQQQTGYVPIVLRVRQPVRVKLGKLKLFKVKFLVRCRLNVDSLSANNDIRIRDSSCKFRLRL